MAFRADEAAQDGYERAKRVLVLSPGVEVSKRQVAEDALQDLIAQYGPVVDSYPTWHPLVPQNDPRMPVTYPSERAGYKGLDHTIFFVNAFVSCPYGDGEEIIKSVEAMRPHFLEALHFDIIAERLKVPFYNSGTTPILVRCEWTKMLDVGNQIPKSLAVPLLIQNEMKAWPGAEVAERWDTMAPYFLGSPHGARSSLFVSQETALAMKRAYMAMVESGMFGPLHMG